MVGKVGGYGTSECHEWAIVESGKCESGFPIRHRRERKAKNERGLMLMFLADKRCARSNDRTLLGHWIE